MGSRQKEAVYFIVDVHNSMNHIDNSTNKTQLETAKDCIKLYIQRKLLFTKHDVMGICLVGTNETHNHLYDNNNNDSDNTQYKHVDNFLDIVPIKLNCLSEIDSIELNNNTHIHGDLIDSLVLCMDRLTTYCSNKQGKLLKSWKKTIFIFTNAKQNIDDDYDSIKQIMQALNDNEYHINIIGFDFSDLKDDSNDNNDDIQVKRETDDTNPYNIIELKSTSGLTQQEIKNQQLLYYITQNISYGQVMSSLNAIELLNTFSKRTVLQVTKLRGDLAFGLAGEQENDNNNNNNNDTTTESQSQSQSLMNISIYTYASTSLQQFPTMKRITKTQRDKLEAIAQDGYADHNDTIDEIGVKQERTHKTANTDDNDVAALDDDNIIKSYHFGKELIPITDDEINSLIKMNTQKGISILGFAEKKVIPRYVYMSSVDAVVAEHGNNIAEIALSALIHALYETDKIAIVRYVKRNNDRVLFGCLTPYITAQYECLHFNQLPYTQDIRDYTFLTLNRSNRIIPTDEQLSVTRDLIRHMDLMNSNVDDSGNVSESLEIINTFNPVLQHLYDNVQHRALVPNHDIQQLNNIIKQYVEPDEYIYKRAHKAISNYDKLFRTEKIEPSKKKQIKNWRDILQEQDITSQLQEQATTQPKHKAKKHRTNKTTLSDSSSDSDIDSVDVGGEYDKLTRQRLEHISSEHPIRDIRIIVSQNKDNATVIIDCIKEMMRLIYEYIDNSVGDSKYNDAFACVKELRRISVDYKQGELFNAYLYELVHKYSSDKIESEFIRRLYNPVSRVLPITSDDDSDSSYTPITAEQFYDNIINTLPQQTHEQIESQRLHDSGIFDTFDDE